MIIMAFRELILSRPEYVIGKDGAATSVTTVQQSSVRSVRNRMSVWLTPTNWDYSRGSSMPSKAARAPLAWNSLEKSGNVKVTSRAITLLVSSNAFCCSFSHLNSALLGAIAASGAKIWLRYFRMPWQKLAMHKKRLRVFLLAGAAARGIASTFLG